MKDPNIMLFAKLLDRFGEKLGSIIRDDRVWDAEERDNVLPKESLNIRLW